MSFIKSLYSFVIFIIFLLPISAQTNISWTGNGGNNQWTNPANWDLKVVPSSDHRVYIPNNADVQYSGNSDIRFLRIGTNAELEITFGTLNISPPINSENYNLINFGSFFNEGNITLNNARRNSLYNGGIVKNRNGISLFSTARTGINNRNEFHNEVSGNIIINEVEGRNINNGYGTFINDGKIEIQDYGQGIFNFDTFINNGDIISGTFNAAKIYCEGSSTFVNSGNIGLNGTLNINSTFIKIELTGSSTFTNLDGGKISLENFEKAIEIKDQSTFENDGVLLMSDLTGTNFGIVTFHNSSFLQSETGLCEINVTLKGILNSIQSSVYNSGKMDISSNFMCIDNIGEMVNHQGAVLILNDAQGGIMMQNSTGTFLNDAATITFNNIGVFDMSLFNEFTNQNCGLINGHARLHLRPAATFINSGTIEYLTDGITHQNDFGTFVNYGIISDPFNRFDNQFTNRKIRSTVLTNPTVNQDIFNVLEIKDDENVSIAQDFSVDPITNTWDAYFDQPYNRITLYSTVVGQDFLYGDVDLEGCPTRVVLRLENVQLPFTGNTPGSSKDQMEFRTAATELEDIEVYPNPSNGLLNLTIPQTEENVTVQIIDMSGRMVWQQQDLNQSLLQIDLQSTVTAGVYTVKVIAGEKTVGTQRWVVNNN